MNIEKECGDGWNKLIDPLIKKCEEEGVEILQIKEKFGGLRFYVSGGSDELHTMIQQAEHLSFQTCETCGGPGKRQSSGWIKTMCDADWKVREDARAKRLAKSFE